MTNMFASDQLAEVAGLRPGEVTTGVSISVLYAFCVKSMWFFLRDVTEFFPLKSTTDFQRRHLCWAECSIGSVSTFNVGHCTHRHSMIVRSCDFSLFFLRHIAEFLCNAITNWNFSLRAGHSLWDDEIRRLSQLLSGQTVSSPNLVRTVRRTIPHFWIECETNF